MQRPGLNIEPRLQSIPTPDHQVVHNSLWSRRQHPPRSGWRLPPTTSPRLIIQQPHEQRNDQYQNYDLVVEIICALPVTQPNAVSACQNYTNNITIPSINHYITVTGPYVLDTSHNNWRRSTHSTPLQYLDLLRERERGFDSNPDGYDGSRQYQEDLLLNMENPHYFPQQE